MLLPETSSRRPQLSGFATGGLQVEPDQVKRQFWLMPLLHSEEHEVVAQAIPLLEQFADAATADVARRHFI